MEVLDKVHKAKDDRELLSIASDLIKKAVAFSSEINDDIDYLGVNVGINATDFLSVDNILSGKDVEYGLKTRFFGYVPLGMKIIYNSWFNKKNHLASNKGGYYYLDDDSYVFDFLKFVKNISISDDYELFLAISDFLRTYFLPPTSNMKREQLHKLIYKDEDTFFEPIRQHSIRDFKGNGSAMCSEYALLAQNLLSIFGFKCLYVIDNNHAYNILLYDDDRAFILDFLNVVGVYDIDFNLLREAPFLEFISESGYSEVKEMVDGKRIKMDDYILQDINGNLYKHILKTERDYGIAVGKKVERSLLLTRHKL